MRAKIVSVAPAYDDVDKKLFKCKMCGKPYDNVDKSSN